MPFTNEVQVRNIVDSKSMRDFGEHFIEHLPKFIKSLKTSDRKISNDIVEGCQAAHVENVEEIQKIMHEVLHDSVTKTAELHAENTFQALLEKNKANAGLLNFFNGWHYTHKTTSLVSAKLIMRLSGDAVFISEDQKTEYNRAMAHMYEVARDDFGLGHKGHDGTYAYLANAFGAESWIESQNEVRECKEFANFLYESGIEGHKLPLNSEEHKQSIIGAMMISIASETWNGREFNYLAQHIENRLTSLNPGFLSEKAALRDAKAFVIGHAGEVENKHGLHALAAAQAFSRAIGSEFSIERLKKVLLDYNERVGKAFSALHRALEMA